IKYLSFAEEWPEGLLRASKYYMSDYTFKGSYFIEQLLNLLLPKRKPPKNMKLYGKSMFWTLTPACLKYVVDFIKSHKDVERFFKFSWASDE
ncbi:hypothetical protein ACI4CD_28700, partial [Klebsiella pneumoniae]|uniref:hypothetical protein n=1 Tax=Klebsiella pneumoniae TaxID=573 RepID=UPI0038531C5D